MKQRITISFLLLLTAACSSTAGLAQNNIFLTLDPASGQPTVVAEPTLGAMIVVRSIDYSGGGQPQPFMLRFDDTFTGKYDVPGAGDPWTNPAVTADGIIFQSSPATFNPGAIPVQEVRIKLNMAAANPDEGYKYDVIMGAGTLDPRIRPR